MRREYEWTCEDVSMTMALMLAIGAYLLERLSRRLWP